MADHEEDDLFADLYDGDDANHDDSAKTAPPVQPTRTKQVVPATKHEPGYGEEPDMGEPDINFDNAPARIDTDTKQEQQQEQEQSEETQQSYQGYDDYEEEKPLQMKDDGKMFIGGLNWETTDQSMFEYFQQFGEVAECTVMRDGATGRSRGFGFLTFKDPKDVNTVMMKEHFLDGKIIDPKRAIPRDEQEKTAKIFVGGVSQEATEKDFTDFFEQFGRVIDATLMMDKDTGRPRGFGFVTFDSDHAVERCLQHQPLEILNKPIEVKRAQPRGKMDEEPQQQNFGGRGRFGNNNHNNFGNQSQNQNQAASQMMAGVGGPNNMSPQMMAQYWQKMQQYFAMMQQAMAANTMGGMNMNPQMMAQMQMQNGGMQNMNPQMQQQMMQMMQMQNGGQGVQSMQGNRNGNAFSSHEQQAFEQRKYEQQANGRGFNKKGVNHNQNNMMMNQGGPQSWEGMYDGEPQPDGQNGGKGSRTGTPSVGVGRAPKGPTPQPSNAPAGAPTGPKNPGKPTGGFRGGRGGGRFHPYGR